MYARGWGQGWQGAGRTIFVLSGVIGIALGDLFTFQSLRHIGPQLAILIVLCLCAPFAAAIEWAWLGTTLTGRQMAGCAVILVGTALSLLPGIRISGAWRRVAWGGALATTASLLQAIGAVFTREACAINEAYGLTINGMTAAYQRVGGAAAMMVFIYFLTRRFSPIASPESSTPPARSLLRAWPWIIANGLTGMVVGMGFFQWALAATPAAIVLSIVSLTPLLVIPIVWTIDGIRPQPLSIIGSVIAIAGALFIGWSES